MEVVEEEKRGRRGVWEREKRRVRKREEACKKEKGERMKGVAEEGKPIAGSTPISTRLFFPCWA